MFKKIFVIALCLIAGALLAACGGTDTQNSDQGAVANQKVTVVLDWTPNTNHTGLYVALKNGYFAEEGLDVEIVQPGDNVANQLVATGKADFGVSYQEEVNFARQSGVPVVSIAAVIQHNTSCFASPVDKGITQIKDFSGKKYGGWGGEVEAALFQYMLDKKLIDKPVENINIGSTDFFTAIDSETVDFSWIFYAWTGIEAEVRGVDLNCVYLKDIAPALDYYTPVLVASEDLLANDPELVKAFLTAASKGYEYCVEHPDEAAAILLEYAPELSADLVKQSQEWLANQYIADASQWGVQKLSVWQNYADWMIDNGLMAEGFDAEAAFTNEYLPQR